MTPPAPLWRLIPSCFPPIAAFDGVARAEDLAAVMDLEGWTNDRLVAERLARLPAAEWLFGVPNASVAMAAFLHAAPAGGRFNGAELGAWYACVAVRTAIAEVAHHLRREIAARGLAEMRRVFRGYSCRLLGEDYIDLRGERAAQPGLYAPDSHAAGQAFGEAARAAGRDGIVYDSLRHAGGVNAVAYRPRHVSEIAQAEHYDILVPARGGILARRLRPG